MSFLTGLKRRAKAAHKAMMVLLALAGCEADLPGRVAVEASPASQPVASRVVLVRAQRSTESTRRQFVARVEAAKTLEATFEVGGTVAELSIREGQTIPRGQRIAALDQTDFKLAEREARVNVRLTRSDYERKRALLGQRGISESAVDDALAQAELARVRAAQAGERLRKTVLIAPFDAYVAERRVEKHSKVQPAMPIARLLDLSLLHLVASVPETLLATLDATDIQSIAVTFAALPGQQFQASYLEHRGEADLVAQTYEVTFTLEPPPGVNLLPGMTATLDLELAGGATSDSALNLPPSALVSAADGTFAVWQVDETTSEVQRRAVVAEAGSGGDIRILDGLDQDALVVASGVNLLREGMRVTSVER